MSRDVANWKDLRDHSPPDSEKKPGVTAFQRVADGRGDKINLDFYSTTFAKPANRTLEAVFKDLRQHFQEFAQGPSRKYDFFPYPNDDPDNPNSKPNFALWTADSPLGVVMRFHLINLPGLSVSSKSQYYFFTVKTGDVQCTCATTHDFIFTTLETKEGKKHPVAGNRGFGLKDNGDGTWTFYTKGADRESAYFGNSLLSSEGSIVHNVVPTVFDEGHKFWLYFFDNLHSYLNAQGMKVEMSKYVNQNSARETYP